MASNYRAFQIPEIYVILGPRFSSRPHAVLFSGVRSSGVEVDLAAAPPPSSYDL